MTHALLDASEPVAFAHRGGSKLFPENTVLAFRHAYAGGCWALELDVRLTRDGHLVVLHDETLTRTTNGTGQVAALSLAQVQSFDAGFRFEHAGGFPFRGQGLLVPTFDEVVRALPEAAFNVELKVPGAADLLLRVIREHELVDRIVVAAQRHLILADFRRRAAHVATSASRDEALCWRASAAIGKAVERPAYRALQLPVSYAGVPLLTHKSIARAHAAGVKVHAWTIDRPADMRDLLELGVDGIMTDRPDILLRVLGSHKRGA